MRVEFKPSIREVLNAVARKAREITDLSKPNAEIAVYLDSWVQRNFTTEGQMVGGWTPFKRGGRYIPGIGIDPTAKLLQDTGALRSSFRAFYTREIVGIGSDLSYSKFHEEGTSVIPRRRILPTRDEVIEPILEIYGRFIGKLLRKSLW